MPKAKRPRCPAKSRCSYLGPGERSCKGGADARTLRLRPERDRRGFLEEGDGDAAVGGEIGVVRKHRLDVGLAGHGREAVVRKPVSGEDLAHADGAPGG